MIDYTNLDSFLRTEIWKDLSVFLVNLENGDERPDKQADIYSFISYKLTSPFINQRGVTVFNTDTEKYELRSAPKVVASFTAYAQNKLEALRIIGKLNDWFRFHGYNKLKEENIVVVTVENTSDRTVFLDTVYDHRVGFDVELRFSDLVVTAGTEDYFEDIEIDLDSDND